jgi:L-alanine-DL-glutamate epimerase-like enolase superfamily enzyme
MAAFKNGYADEFDAVDSKGHVSVPQGPGLGVEIDWEWVKQHETGKVVYE